LTWTFTFCNDPEFLLSGILVIHMELRDLRYFVVVAERLNVARAAEALDMSATALGKSLRRLEKSVGAKLVERAPKGVVLTPVGAALLAQIGPLQGLMSDVRRQVCAVVVKHRDVEVRIPPGNLNNRAFWG
jgi:DNA-binding transcriptional LysR family regulator